MTPLIITITILVTIISGLTLALIIASAMIKDQKQLIESKDAEIEDLFLDLYQHSNQRTNS